MFKELMDKINELIHPELKQTQREAWLDALILASFADRKITQQEQDLIGERVKPEEWTGSVSYDRFFSGSVVRAREVVEGERDLDQYLHTIKDRLNHRERCGELFEVCKTLTITDDKKAKEEKQLLKSMAQIFFYE